MSLLSKPVIATGLLQLVTFCKVIDKVSLVSVPEVCVLEFGSMLLSVVFSGEGIRSMGTYSRIS